MTRMPSLPLWTRKPVSAADYRAQTEALMSEREVQRTLLGDLANPYLTDGPVLAFHVPNGFWLPGVSASVSARIWRTLAADGARTGAADLIVCHKGRVLFLELKRLKGGLLTEEQKRFRDDCRLCGVQWKHANGLSEARQILVDFGALRGQQ